MQVLIQKFHITQILPGEVALTWELSNMSQTYHFFVERSGSPGGDFETLNNIAITRSYGYIDRQFNDESFIRKIYYRIKAINAADGSIVYSDVYPLNYESDIFTGLAIARNKNLLLRRFVGNKCFLLIRKTFGAKCPDCYDSVRQKVTNSYCLTCFGTSFIGGYFAPIELYMQLNPLLKVKQSNELQVIENSRIDGNWCGNFPILSPGDLLVDGHTQDLRYIIESPIIPTEQKSALVEQRFPLTRVHLSRIEMKVLVPELAPSINDVCVFRKDYI